MVFLYSRILNNIFVSTQRFLNYSASAYWRFEYMEEIYDTILSGKQGSIKIK